MPAWSERVDRNLLSDFQIQALRNEKPAITGWALSWRAGDGIPDIGKHVPSWPAASGAAGAPGRANPRRSLPSVSLRGSSTWQGVAAKFRRRVPSSQITGVSLPHFLKAQQKVRVPSPIWLLQLIINDFARLSIGTVADKTHCPSLHSSLGSTGPIIRGQMGSSVKVKHERKIMMSSIYNGLRHDYRRAAIAPRLNKCLWMDFSATTVLRLVRDAQIQTGLAYRRVW